MLDTLILVDVWFQVLTEVAMKTSSIFWDITPCSPLKVNRRFGGTYRTHLQGRRIRRARNQRESRWQAVPPKRRLTFNELHGVISQKIALFTLIIVSESIWRAISRRSMFDSRHWLEPFFATTYTLTLGSSHPPKKRAPWDISRE
jgi:hypothetical protein